MTADCRNSAQRAGLTSDLIVEHVDQARRLVTDGNSARCIKETSCPMRLAVADRSFQVLASGHRMILRGITPKENAMQAKLRMAVAALVLAAPLASCGDSGSDNAPRDDATTSTWSLERAEKEWDQFGIRYDEGFTPVDELEGSKDVKAYNEACKGFAEALRVNEEKAATGKWPGELKSKMDNFAVLLEKEAEAVDVCSNAKTMKQVDEGLRLQRRDSAGSAGMGIQHYFEEANAK